MLGPEAAHKPHLEPRQQPNGKTKARPALWRPHHAPQRPPQPIVYVESGTLFTLLHASPADKETRSKGSTAHHQETSLNPASRIICNENKRANTHTQSIACSFLFNHLATMPRVAQMPRPAGSRSTSGSVPNRSSTYAITNGKSRQIFAMILIVALFFTFSTDHYRSIHSTTMPRNEESASTHERRSTKNKSTRSRRPLSVHLARAAYDLTTLKMLLQLLVL